MKTLHTISDLRLAPGPHFLAIGVFDGVHLGHQAVIRQALRHTGERGGSAVVVTFHPHPERILSPATAPRLLTSTQHKILLLRRMGVENMLIIPFDEEFAATPAEDFVRQLVEAGDPLAGICVGQEWVFGKGARGNVDLLRKMGGAHNFVVEAADPVTVKGEVVSSTRIRGYVQEGDFVAAGNLLGRRFTIHGNVAQGAGLGRQIGFPTANLKTHNEQFPPDGVYAIVAHRGTQNLPGIANLGWRPTVAQEDPQRLLEVHLFNFDEDLYGQDLEISFHGRIRDEQKFTGLNELKGQISRDIRIAQRILSSGS